MMEAEIGTMNGIAGRGWEPRDAGSLWKLGKAPSRGIRVLPPHFKILTSRTTTEEICFGLSHWVCGNLLQQPSETDTVLQNIF